MKREIEFVVPARLDGCVLRDVLRRELGFSAKQLTRMKQHEGAICCNSVPVYVIHRVHTGDRLHLILEEDMASETIVPKQGKLDIRFENQDVLILEKPAGLAVHPAPGDRENTLGNFVVWHYQSQGESIVYRPVNRLDRGTSGLMVIAKNAHSHAALAQQLHSETFVREYLAVVEGSLTDAEGIVSAPIARVEGSVLRREVSSHGAKAVTHYHVEKTVNGRSLVRLRLETGRTHQIRVHMSYLGCPLVGDFLYGKESNEISRCALHSARLILQLPFSNECVELESPLPSDMRKLLKEE